MRNTNPIIIVVNIIKIKEGTLLLKLAVVKRVQPLSQNIFSEHIARPSPTNLPQLNYRAPIATNSETEWGTQTLTTDRISLIFAYSPRIQGLKSFMI